MSAKDTDPIKINNEDNLIGIFNELIGRIQIKLFVLIIIVFLLIHTETFIHRILGKIKGAVDVGTVTPYGILLMAVILFISCIAIDALIGQNVI